MKFCSGRKNIFILMLSVALILSACSWDSLSAIESEASEIQSLAEKEDDASELVSAESKEAEGVTSTEMSEEFSQIFQSPEEYIRYGIADAVEKVESSVVSIVVSSKYSGGFLGDYMVEEKGSGVIISSSGYIATNFHVIEGAENVKVYLSNSDEYEATVIGKDAKTDLAVLKIESESELVPAIFSKSSTLRVGDFVFSIGNALGKYSGSVTMGIISSLSRDVSVNDETMKMLQTDAPLNSGNSGGGLFDSHGYLVGIVSAKDSGDDVEGIGFAVPIDVAKAVFDDIINHGYVTGRPTLGFTTVDITSMREASYYGVDWIGVYISSIDAGSNGENAGLRSRDYIYSVNEEVITTSERLKEIVEESKVGDVLLLEVWRGNDSIDVVLVIGEDVG